jgi:Protein of unknown function (DUF4065)
MPAAPKIKSLIHYICHKCQNNSQLGATKLNKILWFADSFVYRTTGRTVSGSHYKKLPFGPVPTEASLALDELMADGKITIKTSLFFGKSKKDFISLTDPDSSFLDCEERKLIDQLISYICDGHTAKSISELSHDIIWESASIGEEIPMCAVLASSFATITEEDISWADNCLRGLPA